MNTIRRISPICPKCKQQNTYDIIPELPDMSDDLNEADLIGLHKFTVGNAKYHCIDCGHNWKKYRGKKPYDRIKVIHADVGGFPGPYFNVKINQTKNSFLYNSLWETKWAHSLIIYSARDAS